MGKRVIVVGAGITGVASAEWLRRDGWQVTLVDRGQPGSAHQASFGNAGLLARCAVVPNSEPGLWQSLPFMLASPSSPLFLRWRYLARILPWLVSFLSNSTPARAARLTGAIFDLVGDSVDQHLALAKGTPAEAFIRTGDYLDIYRSRAAYEREHAVSALKARYGFTPEYLDRAALLERLPELGPSYTFAVAYGDHGWLVSPSGYVAALAAYFQAQGGAYRQGEVTGITPGIAPSVTLAGGERLVADKIVLAAGAWSGRISGARGLRRSLETERGYHISMYGPNILPDTPFMVADASFVVTPMDGFLRAAGIVELGGLEAPQSAAPFRLIERQLRDVFPTLTYERAERWMGFRPTFPDSLPAIGERPDQPNLIHAYGGQHVGLTMGAKVGRMVRDIAGGRRLNLDMEPYRPDRF